MCGSVWPTSWSKYKFSIRIPHCELLKSLLAGLLFSWRDSDFCPFASPSFFQIQFERWPNLQILYLKPPLGLDFDWRNSYRARSHLEFSLSLLVAIYVGYRISGNTRRNLLNGCKWRVLHPSSLPSIPSTRCSENLNSLGRCLKVRSRLQAQVHSKEGGAFFLYPRSHFSPRASWY